MNETAVEVDKRKAESIRRQYIDREDTKIEKLQKLDSKVKYPGKIAACILYILGSLIMGSGMSLIMVWEDMQIGLLLGIPGLIILVGAYPIYKGITNHRKQKYAAEIVKLSDEIDRGEK